MLVACRSTPKIAPEKPINVPDAGGGPAPLAQDFTVAAHIPNDGNYYYMHDPGMTMLPSGKVLVAAPCLGESTTGAQNVDHSVRVFIARSSDGGQTWDTVATLPYSDATPFVSGGRLFMFVQKKKWENVSLVTSTDDGTTWSDPVILFSGVYWNCHTSMAIERGKIHWALQTDDPTYTQSGLVVISGDVSKDLMAPASWQMSEKAAHPGTPPAIVPANVQKPAWWGGNVDEWLEPNVVSVNGRMRVLLRTIIDGYGTAGATVVCDFDDATAPGQTTFSQFYPMPCGQNKFFILKDAPSRLFWMLGNLPADSQAQIFDWNAVRADGHFLPGPGNDRRFLMLFYSVDALNWFPAGCVARADGLGHSFMYPAADVDGDDLVLIARSSINGQSQHDADAVTFHRVKNFRALAMNLYA